MGQKSNHSPYTAAGFSILLAVCTALSATAPIAHGDTASAEGVGYQAFQLTFHEITRRLPELSRRGYTFVQVSPVQKSISVPQWWALYQPLDYSQIAGPLGNEEEFQALTRAAHRLGLKIIVDVVFNHMANLRHAPGYSYAQFSGRDFHFPDTRPCIENWSDRYQVTNYWLCFSSQQNRKPSLGDGGLPDLDTSSQHVRSVHRHYLEKLLSLGADGFRFDSAKHIEPEYFSAILKGLRAGPPPWSYGEVIGMSSAEYAEYTPLMDVTDFRLLGTILETFNSAHGDLRALPHAEADGKALPARSAVVFARNHDTAMGQDFFRFKDPRNIPLAMAFIFAQGRGLPFVYREDAELPMVQAGVVFYRHFQGIRATTPRASSFCKACDHPDLLFLERHPLHAPAGLAILNKSERWFEPITLYAPGLAPGCYRELSFDFSIQVVSGPDGKSHIHSWGNQPQVRIGPKTALFIVPEGIPTTNGGCPRVRSAR